MCGNAPGLVAGRFAAASGSGVPHHGGSMAALAVPPTRSGTVARHATNQSQSVNRCWDKGLLLLLVSRIYRTDRPATSTPSKRFESAFEASDRVAQSLALAGEASKRRREAAVALLAEAEEDDPRIVRRGPPFDEAGPLD